MGFHSPNLLEDGYDIRPIQELLGHKRRGDDDDLYSRAEPWRQRRQESGGRTLNRDDSGYTEPHKTERPSPAFDKMLITREHRRRCAARCSTTTSTSCTSTATPRR